MTAKKTNGPALWLRPAQMISELGISKRTWARMRAARTAPKCVRMPGGLRCRQSWFDAWLAEREANAA
jgi:predicted DNA-binding transcriptional regulator AlpA